MKHFLRLQVFAMLVGLSATGLAQKRLYTTGNAHSHNDYVNAVPFYLAYNTGFGSIEADIYLFGNRLLVGHDSADMVKNLSLESLYIRPVDSCIKANRGNIFRDAGRQLILLIDIKNAPAATLDSLIALLRRYPAVTGCKTLRIAITGSRPNPESFTSFPDFIGFDGVLSDSYPAAALSRIVLFSDNLRRYAGWKGDEPLTASDAEKLRAAIKKAHDWQKTRPFLECTRYTLCLGAVDEPRCRLY